MMITFYTTNCPKCSVLKNKLDTKHITYDTCEDSSIMLQKGITSAPALEVDGKIFNFKDAIKFINDLEVCL